MGRRKKQENTDTGTELSGLQRRLANLRPPWAKGESGNPSGGRKLSDEEKAARKAARYELARYQVYKEMTQGELLALDLSKLPVIDVLFIRKILDDLKNIDTAEIHRMYTRQLGAPKQDAETGGLNITNGKVTIKISAGPPQRDDGSGD